MTKVKKTILFIHRWLGFISGLVVLIVSLTGCIFCFQDEIQDAIYSYRHVPAESKSYIKPSELKQRALAAYPGATANYIYYYGKGRPASVLVNSKKAGYLAVYYNPYTGRQLHAEVYAKNFFVIVEYIHLYLLLPDKAGRLVVGISVLIFVALMITGIVLWWPKRKSDRKRSFTIKWNGRWRRVNYDLHNVLGFYATAIALILAITGLSISFGWMTNGIYKTGNLGKTYPIEKTYPKSDTLSIPLKSDSKLVDHAFIYAQQLSPSAQMFLIGDDDSKAGVVSVTAYPKTLHFAYNDNYEFDRYSGKLLRYLPNVKKSTGMKLNDMNYDIHVGQIAGLPGKIMAFIASLICASLPVTGLIIYLGKRKKPKTTRKIKHAVDRRNKFASA